MSKNKINLKAVHQLSVPLKTIKHVDEFANFQKAVNRKNRLTGGKCLKPNGNISVPKMNQHPLQESLTTKFGETYSNLKQQSCRDADISKGGSKRKGKKSPPLRSLRLKSLHLKSLHLKSLPLRSRRLKPQKSQKRKSGKNKKTKLSRKVRKSRKR